MISVSFNPGTIDAFSEQPLQASVLRALDNVQVRSERRPAAWQPMLRFGPPASRIVNPDNTETVHYLDLAQRPARESVLPECCCPGENVNRQVRQEGVFPPCLMQLHFEPQEAQAFGYPMIHYNRAF